MTPNALDASLRAELRAVRSELAAAHEEILLSRQSEGETMADLLRTRAELARVRSLLGIALPHVEASAGADHMLDGFRPRRRPIDDGLDAIRSALANNAKDET